MSIDGYFEKATGGRPAAWEIAGLDWLAEQETVGGARIAHPHKELSTDHKLVEEKVVTASPNPKIAAQFGASLAITHEISGANWGEGPTGWQGDGYQGPNSNLLPLQLGSYTSWGKMYAELRIKPLMKLAGRQLDSSLTTKLDHLCARLSSGDFDTDDVPARLHGDLWAGNVLWSTNEVVLIDPSAYVGSREADLASLFLFGCSYLREIIAGYQSVHPLAADWESRIPLNQLSMLLMHVVVFGGSYVNQVAQVVNNY